MQFLAPAVNHKLDSKGAIKHAIPVSARSSKGDLDMGFRPRAVQKKMYQVLAKHHNAVFVIHRRAGKTKGLLQWMIHCGLNINTQGRPHDSPPRLLYAAPTQKMAKRIAWNYLIEASKIIPGTHVLGGDQPILTLPNGAKIEVLGAHNPDNLRGTYVDVAVLDEYAYMNPDVVHNVLNPQLLDYKGRLVLCSTPAGRNDFWRQYDSYRKKPSASWGAYSCNINESGVFPPEQMEAEKEKYIAQGNIESWEREYMCNFDAPVAGSYWGKIIARLRAEEMITDVPFDPTRKVITCWDIGLRDDTAIWFMQATAGGRVKVIDHISESNISTLEWVKRINEKPYDYEVAVLPHDARKRSSDTLMSFVQHLNMANLRTFVLPKSSPQVRIEAARQVLQVCMFDAKKCEKGLDALSLYQRTFNAETQAFSKQPQHDWTSHSADAFGYGSEFMAVKLGMSNPEAIRATIGMEHSSREIDKMLEPKPDRLVAKIRGRRA